MRATQHLEAFESEGAVVCELVRVVCRVGVADTRAQLRWEGTHWRAVRKHH